MNLVTRSFAASALALHLYQVYLLSPDEPVVETADLLDHMMAYRPPSDNDEVNFQKRVRAAITSLDEAGLIKPVKGTERYVIQQRDHRGPDRRQHRRARAAIPGDRQRSPADRRCVRFGQ